MGRSAGAWSQGDDIIPVAMENRLYKDLAYLWPLLDPPEEYTEEASFWRQALREKLGAGRHKVLELGVGGGHLLSHLTGDVQATAVDISPQMLAHSKALNPDVEHHLGDMRSVRLGRKFQAVLIHDAISYLLTEEDLSATFATARAHLNPGGILVTVPDWFLETFSGTTVEYRTRIKDDMEFTYIQYSTDVDPADSTVETVFVYFIKKDDQLEVEVDRHVTGIFPLATWEDLLAKAGFEVETRPYPVYDDGGEGYLLVATLRGDQGV